MAYTALSSKAVGSIVKLKESGTLVDYLIVHQGRPSTLYDTSCDGTWLLRKDVLNERNWHSSNENDYANSTIQAYLNSTFLNRFETNIKNAIKQVKIPYRPGKGTSGNVNSGANGLLCKIFLLSGYEVGWTTATDQHFPEDGTCLTYFKGTAATDAKRIAYLNGGATIWWLRSPWTYTSIAAWSVLENGARHMDGCCVASLGARPALILPSSLFVSDSGAVTVNTAPTMPSSITVPADVLGGQNLTVSWGTATDAESNLSGYILERQYNGGSWTQRYKGISRSYTDAITFGWNTVAYRVKAYDSVGANSGYRTSPTRTVVNNTAPTISGTDSNIGTKTGAFNQAYTITDTDSGQTITAVEKIDGVQKRSFTATSGQSYSFHVTAAEWMKLLNGSHTLTITATDNYGGTVTRTYTFSKNETEIELTLATPLTADDQITKAIMSVTRQIPAGATFTVEVCNNGNDASPTWEDVTQSITSGSKFFFTNSTKTAAAWAFNFRIKVNRNGAKGDCFISSAGGNFE